MKMKLKKILIITIIVLLALLVVTSSDAATITGQQLKSAFKGSATSPTGSAAVVQILNTVLGIVQLAGGGIAVVMLLTISAKYIMASAGDRADIKKYAVNYCVGAIILFGATGILGVVKNFVNNSLKHGA